MNPFERLWGLVSSYKADISAIYFYAILSGLVQLTVPMGVQAIIGFVIAASMVTSTYILIMLVVIGVGAVGLMQINQMKIIERVQQNIFTEHAFEYAEKVPRFDLIKSDSFYLPEKINTFFETLNIQKGLSKILLDVPLASIQIIFGLILLSLYHPVFILFGMILLFILWLILYLTAKRGIKTSFEQSTLKYSVVVWLEEIARAIKSFKFTQGTHLNLHKVDERVGSYLDARTDHFKILLIQYKTLVIFKVVITTLMLTAGVYLLLTQKLNIGEFVATEIVILTIITAVEKLIGSLDSIYDVVTGLEKISLITEFPLEKSGSLQLSEDNNGLSFSFKDVSFSYPDGKEIFDRINVDLPTNTLMCIKSNQGSGKTTFLKLLTGNYTNFTGSLLLNNYPIQHYKTESVRSKIGIYFNQQEIFSATVMENITMGRKDISEEDIWELANKLGFSNAINQLELGLYSLLDPTGKKLSGSLVRYILLLRAFANKPKLLLLEDPFLGLSVQHIETLKAYLLEISGNCTILVSTNDSELQKTAPYLLEITKNKVELLKNA